MDYKTGKVTVDDYEIDDTNFERIAEAIFAQDTEERPGIAFQFYIYDLLLREKGHDAGRQVRNSIYSMATIFKEQPQTLVEIGNGTAYFVEYGVPFFYYITNCHKLHLCLVEWINVN